MIMTFAKRHSVSKQPPAVTKIVVGLLGTRQRDPLGLNW